MERIAFGTAGFDVSILGLGCSRLGSTLTASGRPDTRVWASSFLSWPLSFATVAQPCSAERAAAVSAASVRR